MWHEKSKHTSLRQTQADSNFEFTEVFYNGQRGTAHLAS
jgi:hypothetical protein